MRERRQCEASLERLQRRGVNDHPVRAALPWRMPEAQDGVSKGRVPDGRAATEHRRLTPPPVRFRFVTSLEAQWSSTEFRFQPCGFDSRSETKTGDSKETPHRAKAQGHRPARRVHRRRNSACDRGTATARPPGSRPPVVRVASKRIARLLVRNADDANLHDRRTQAPRHRRRGDPLPSTRDTIPRSAHGSHHQSHIHTYTYQLENSDVLEEEGRDRRRRARPGVP